MPLAGTRFSRHAARWTLFAVLQLVLASALLAAAAYRAAVHEAARGWPPFRNEPVRVVPIYDLPAVVSDEQLARVLGRLVPRLDGPQTQINHIDHAQRFWGLEATFDDPRIPSGQQLRRILLDQPAFSDLYGPQTPPLLIDDGRDVRVRTQDGIASASHHDHTLAGQAEVGTTLDHPVVTTLRQTTVRNLLETSLRDFSLNQAEYEWSILAYTLYLPTSSGWYSSEGQWIDFDRLAARIMREDVLHGVCAANHRLHALVMMLRVDDQQPILSTSMRQRIIRYLRGVTDTLVATQTSEGYWTKNWPGAGPQHVQPSELDPLAEKILATGHPMEWWALAPEELHPPRHVLVAAGQWLVRTIDSMTPREIAGAYTFLTHAGRALALWRGRLPAQVPLTFTPGDWPPLSAASADGSTAPGEPRPESAGGRPGGSDPSRLSATDPTTDRGQRAAESAGGRVPGDPAAAERRAP